MHNIINMYLKSLGFRSITEYEVNQILHYINSTRKVDAIKYLRTCVQTEDAQLIQVEQGEYGKNYFQKWMQENNLQYIFTCKRLGLKEARDIIEIMKLNLDSF